MTWWESLILGVVEGLTEYLPVSSTGHLLLVQRLIGIESSVAADAFAITIQGGAIVAVLGLYFNRVKQMALGMVGKDREGFLLARNILTAFMPAAIIGLFLEKHIRKYLFAGESWDLWPTVFAWFVGGVAILLTAYYRRNRQADGTQGFELTELTVRMALIIGLAQCIAMWPGTSRSLVTIVSGVLVGMSLKSAVEFSFLLGVLTLSAATAYDGLRYGGEMLDEFGVGVLAVGFVAAWLSAVIAVKWMVSYLQSHGLSIFGWYRIALAIAVTFYLVLR